MSNKILIVDDDIDSLKLIGLMLQRQGYEVIAASAGNQALAKATSENPSLIILDVMMPDMDGYEVCRRLRANPDTVPTRIQKLFLSSCSRPRLWWTTKWPGLKLVRMIT